MGISLDTSPEIGGRNLFTPLPSGLNLLSFLEDCHPSIQETRPHIVFFNGLNPGGFP